MKFEHTKYNGHTLAFGTIKANLYIMAAVVGISNGVKFSITVEILDDHRNYNS